MARGVGWVRDPLAFHPQEKRVFCGFVFIGYTVLMKICDIKGCNSKHHGKGYCYFHYWAWLTTGDALLARKARGRPKGGGAKGGVRRCSMTGLDQWRGVSNASSDREWDSDTDSSDGSEAGVSV